MKKAWYPMLLTIGASACSAPPVTERVDSTKNPLEKSSATNSVSAASLPLVLPSSWPVGSSDPAIFDPDADGIPSSADNCPHIPNPKEAGVQPLVCGKQLGQALQERVFLRSRTFAPHRGLDPRVLKGDGASRVHVLLHANQQLGPSSALRRALERRGVKLLAPIPRRTYFASIDTALLEEVVQLPGVLGVSAIEAADRVAPELRLRGPRGAKKRYPATLEVEFFEDTPTSEREQVLKSLGTSYLPVDDGSYHARVESFEQIAALSQVDSIEWIEEVPSASEGLVDQTQNAWGFADAEPVIDHLDLTGAGMTVALVERTRVSEVHPELDVTHGNSPLDLTEDDPSHAQAVAAIIAADGTSFPERRGFLPDADLISYEATSIMTSKKIYYKFPKQASEDHGASLINYSIGISPNCNKLGRYTKMSKWRDRAVREFDILPVVASGNTVDGTGALIEDCLGATYGILGHDIAKNELLVGNWDITDVPELSYGSRTGPTEDGRLKPDVIAPGSDIETIDFDPDIGLLSAISFGGTSAATPVATGIAGWVVESLGSAASAHVVKGILVHTALDVGPTGPDFRHGYGVVQAAPAVRIAREWSSYGWEDTMPDTGGTLSHTIDIGVDTFSYKVTLAWTDLEAATSAPLALVQDLNLSIEAPDGTTIYYPWDLTDETAPGVPGTGPDVLNNVEQIVLQNSDGSPLEPGEYTVRVSAAPLDEDQPFAVVLTPPCPLRLTESLTLTGDLRCSTNPMVPSVVEIIGDDVVLDCNGHSISGAGSGAGVRIKGDRATVRGCEISDVGVGISLEDSSADSLVTENVISDIADGIIIAGTRHRIEDNDVEDISKKGGRGIVLGGQSNTVGGEPWLANRLAASAAPNSIGIEVPPGSSNNVASHNAFTGSWPIGMRQQSGLEDQAIEEVDFLDNTFEGTRQPIVLSGNVKLALVQDNEIAVFDPAQPAIRIDAIDELEVENAQLIHNIITGDLSAAQTGIAMKQTFEAVLRENQIQDVGTGISEEKCLDSTIQQNAVFALPPFRVTTGVLSMNSSASSLVFGINNNPITGARTGISVSGTGPHNVSGNTIAAQQLGISLSSLNTTTPARVSGNILSVDVGTGISIADSPEVFVDANTISDPNATNSSGIVVTNSPGASIGGNFIYVDIVGIDAEGDALEIDDNTVGSLTRSPNIAIRAAGDDCTIDDNTIENATGAGLHLLFGNDAGFENNTIQMAGGSGIRLGSEPLGACTGAVNVDNATLVANTISGATVDVEALCDVGSYSVTP